MKLLAIDTTGAYSSVAIYDDGKITQIINEDNYSHLQKLIPVIQNLLEKENVKPQDLDAIAVSMGPGSFTGIRIGMATAKGLAQIWNKPIVEVPTLASFAFKNLSWLDEKDVAICPVFDAKRHQIYGGAYKIGSDAQLIPDSAYDLDDYLKLLAEAKDKYSKVVFFGDGIKAYEETLNAFEIEHNFAPEDERSQNAYAAAMLGAKLFSEGKTTDCYNAKPEYLRAAEAERKLAEKLKADSEKFGTAKENKY